MPKITGPEGLKKSIEDLKVQYPRANLIYGGFGAEAKSVVELLGDGGDVVAFVGPEGGLTGEEEYLLRVSGGCEVRLSDTVLRIETAGVAFAAVLCGRGCAAE